MIREDAALTLHGYYRSSAAFRIRIALNLKGLDYRSVPHHLRHREQNAEPYRTLNPQQLVPALEVDGAVLTQSLAILEYLDEAFPEPPLLPADPIGRARARAMALAIACDIHPIDNLRVLAYLKGEMAQPQDAIDRWYAHWITLGFAALEAILSPQHIFCCGDAPTIADICLVPQVWNARRMDVELGPFPRIVAIADRALALPAFDGARPENQPDAE